MYCLTVHFLSSIHNFYFFFHEIDINISTVKMVNRKNLNLIGSTEGDCKKVVTKTNTTALHVIFVEK